MAKAPRPGQRRRISDGTQPAGSLRASPSVGRLAVQALRDVLVRELVIAVVAGVVALTALVIWPRVSLALSQDKAVVQALDSAAIYATPGVGLTDSERSEVASIVGTRPLVTVLLTRDDVREMGLSARPLDLCRSIVAYHRDVIAQVVLDGDFAAGCEGDDVELGAGVDWFGWDIRFWMQHDRATAFATGNVGDFARQLALAYDAEVLGDRVVPTERTFSAPDSEVAIAVGLLAGTAVGAVGIFLLLRLVIRRSFAAADRRRGWEYQRDEIDGQLGDIALTMIGADPRIGPPPAVVAVATELAPAYAAALADLAAAAPGQELAGLAERVADLRRRLAEAEAGARGVGP